MKSLLQLLFITTSFINVINAQLVNEQFLYSDGNLVGNGGWESHSGAGSNPVQIVSQQIVINQVSGAAEDVNLAFTNQTSGVLYASFDINLDDLGSPISGTDSEYFFHFMTSTNGSFVTRIDIVPPSGSGDYTLGMSISGGTADITYPSDLLFGQTYNIAIKYNFSNGISRLYVDPVNSQSVNIATGTSTPPTAGIGKLAFRQATSSSNEIIRIDNIIITNLASEVNLPVEFSRFTAKNNGKNIDLLWSTASELNNDRFEILRSTDGKSFEMIGSVAGQGTSLKNNNYSFVDEQPIAGMNYYKLKQVDFDGRYDFSDVIVVENGKLSNIRINPTTTSDYFTISTDSKSSVSIVNTSGQIVAQQANDEGIYTFDMQHLPKGLYFVTVASNGNVETKKVVKN